VIHVTFENGRTALFDANEKVWVCRKILNGEYIVDDRYVRGSGLKPGLFVLQGDVLEPEIVVESPIQRVRVL
jgi:hypothetical protein